MTVERMKRAILLQINPTASKSNVLREFEVRAVALANYILSKKTSSYDFHNSSLYRECKDSSGFNTQVVTAISRAVFKMKGSSTKRITVKFNVPRNCKAFSTKTLDFIELGLYPRQRAAIPIVKNRNFQRYSDLLKGGWTCKTYGLTPDLQIVAYLSKDETALPRNKNVLGVDVNSKCFAVSVISPNGKVLRQGYFGKDIWQRRKKIFERKSRLRGYADTGSESARLRLRKTGLDEYNFVKNRIGEVVRDIVNLAVEYDADIAIEDLKKFSPKGKRFNREVMRIPFYTFRKNLQSRCFDKGIILDIKDSWHTSKWCTHCGAVGKGHDSKVYALFRCRRCGQIVNSDRKASLAVAVKSLLERDHSLNKKILRFPIGESFVNTLIRPDEAGLVVAVHNIKSSHGKPTRFSGG